MYLFFHHDFIFAGPIDLFHRDFIFAVSLCFVSHFIYPKRDEYYPPLADRSTQ
jgi:hypothetical protein